MVEILVHSSSRSSQAGLLKRKRWYQVKGSQMWWEERDRLRVHVLRNIQALECTLCTPKAKHKKDSRLLAKEAAQTGGIYNRALEPTH
jgi:hypothetical protein